MGVCIALHGGACVVSCVLCISRPSSSQETVDQVQCAYHPV